ncbi:MAG: glycine cleavage system protein H [Spirochaetales bacterium]|nr:glycine cleavage system protein H [Spirochaetales bacterium]
MTEKRYTKNGEWAAWDRDRLVVGLSRAAVEALGEVTFVAAPIPGQKLSPGAPSFTVEAVKAAADFETPVAGTVVLVNELLKASPEILNKDPENEGWIFVLVDADRTAWESLLDSSSYQTWTEGEGGAS